MGQTAGSRPLLVAVEGYVDEAVRRGVLLAAHVADRPALEGAQGRLHLAVELSHRRVLDLVLALDLAHDQLRVADQLELARPQLSGPFDPEQQRPVLGDVVGGDADPLAALLHHPALAILDHRADRRRARVAASAAVHVHDQLHGNQPTGSPSWLRRDGETPSSIRPPSPAPAFHCRAEPSSCSISSPLPSWKTARISLPRSTPHWYQPSSQATVIRTSPAEPAAEPIDTRGSPRVRIRPATVRTASLALKRAAARSSRLRGVSAASGAGRFPTLAPGAAGSTQPSRSASPRQSSQTRFGPSFGLM